MIILDSGFRRNDKCVWFIRFFKGLNIVWDKAASIKFKQPGRSTLYAIFKIEEAELVTIREELKTKNALDRVYKIDLKDKDGVICAIVEKTIHFKRKA